MPTLREEILACRACDVWKNYKVNVPFDGNPEADLFFLGRDPGADEIVQGKPFVGKAGKEFDGILIDAGINPDRSGFYIANIVCCRPLNNIAPDKEVAHACANKFVVRALDEVKPKVVVTLGREAAMYLTGSNLSMGQMRGHTFYPKIKGHFVVVPTWHPSYIARLKNMDPLNYEVQRNNLIKDLKFALTYCKQ